MKNRSVATRIGDVFVGLLAWAVCCILMGLSARVMWELLALGWNIL